MPIDLHVHSTASDGHSTPSEVVAEAAAAGLDTIALTDHDTTAGWAEAGAAAERLGVRLIPGVEISCQLGGISVHLLGYLLDPRDAALRRMWEATRASRERRARLIVEKLSADVPVTWEDVLEQTRHVTTIGRPHIADALVARGVVTSRDHAFATILRPGSPYYARYLAPDGIEAVRAVVGAGGVAVMAHPLARRRGRVVGDSAIADNVAVGMSGQEVDHRDQDDAERAHLRALAADLGLLTTGSSDYHGTGKQNRIGENTTTPQALEAIFERAGAAAADRNPLSGTS